MSPLWLIRLQRKGHSCDLLHIAPWRLILMRMAHFFRQSITRSWRKNFGLCRKWCDDAPDTSDDVTGALGVVSVFNGGCHAFRTIARDSAHRFSTQHGKAVGGCGNDDFWLFFDSVIWCCNEYANGLHFVITSNTKTTPLPALRLWGLFGVYLHESPRFQLTYSPPKVTIFKIYFYIMQQK